jgi:hypothetical protein
MIRRIVVSSLVALSLLMVTRCASAQERAFGAIWGGNNQAGNMERFYHYPYVYYPQNYWGGEYYRSADSLYYRYPPEMRVPVYNRQWYNEYPTPRRYHWGHHFITDVF